MLLLSHDSGTGTALIYVARLVCRALTGALVKLSIPELKVQSSTPAQRTYIFLFELDF